MLEWLKYLHVVVVRLFFKVPEQATRDTVKDGRTRKRVVVMIEQSHLPAIGMKGLAEEIFKQRF